MNAKPPPFPTHVKVGWKRFKVVDWDPAVAAARSLYGECDHLAATIRVDTTKGPRQVAETLWHECIHATFDIGSCHATQGGRNDEYAEEFLVSHFASWTMTLLVDNPHLGAYLSWATSYEEPDD